MRHVFLAIDGGNSKTVAVVADAEGAILGAGRAGCGDIHGARAAGRPDDPESGLREVAAAARTALDAAGASGADVLGATFALAGADWPEDADLYRRELSHRLGLAVTPVVVNDCIGVLRAGTPDAVGVAIVVGTYAAIGGRNAAGAVHHHGFWPDALGARGLGAAALRAVHRAALELDPPTPLTARALAAFGAQTPDDLLHRFTRTDGLGAEAAARLAPAVLDEAAGGDPVAAAIVDQQVTQLVEAATVSARRLGLEQGYALVLGGGVLRHPSRLLVRAIGRRMPQTALTTAGDEPVVGALRLALDAAGARVDPVRLAATLPGLAFFAAEAVRG